MQAIVKTPHINLNIKGKLSTFILNALKKEYGKKLILREEEEETLDYLKSKEFELIIDSTELPPYDSASLTNHIELKRNEKTLTIGQSDWRDDYYIYRIDINGRTEYEIVYLAFLLYLC